MTETVDCGVACPHCKVGTIMAEIRYVQHVPGEIPIGPGSRGYFSPEIHSFYCGNSFCALVFKHPPGNPRVGSEILEKLRREQEKRLTLDDHG